MNGRLARLFCFVGHRFEFQDKLPYAWNATNALSQMVFSAKS